VHYRLGLLAREWDRQRQRDRESSVESDQAMSLRKATAAGATMGTPSYMSPEQAVGRVEFIDERTDIYGLGTILFDIFTGQPPPGGDNRTEVLARIVSGETPRVKSIAISTPPGMDAICAKAMAKLPEGRQDGQNCVEPI